MPQLAPASPIAVTTLESADPAVADLESMMLEFVSCYERLLDLVRRRHDAMRRARTDELAACIHEESVVIQRIAELEKARLRVVGVLAERFGSPQNMYTRLSWIADRLGEPTRGKLTGVAQRLRELIETVRRENETVGLAARALALHMEGLMRQLAGRLNHAQVYSRAGAVEAGPRVVSAIDLTS